MKRIFSRNNLLGAGLIAGATLLALFILYPVAIILALCAVLYLIIVCLRIALLLLLVALPLPLFYLGHWIIGIYLLACVAGLLHSLYKGKFFTIKNILFPEMG